MPERVHREVTRQVRPREHTAHCPLGLLDHAVHFSPGLAPLALVNAQYPGVQPHALPPEPQSLIPPESREGHKRPRREPLRRHVVGHAEEPRPRSRLQRPATSSACRSMTRVERSRFSRPEPSRAPRPHPTAGEVSAARKSRQCLPCPAHENRARAQGTSSHARRKGWRQPKPPPQPLPPPSADSTPYGLWTLTVSHVGAAAKGKCASPAWASRLPSAQRWWVARPKRQGHSVGQGRKIGGASV
jgi:hypothetical protein